MMCFYYDETCDVYEEDLRKARKAHKCAGCSQQIAPGQLYVHAHGIFYGPFSYRVCGACELDRYRIHIEELGDGCKWHTSWCPVEELAEYCAETDRERATQEEGQHYFAFRKRRDADYTAAFRERAEQKS